MIVALLVTLALQDTDVSRPSLSLSPRDVEVAQPFELVLEVSHRANIVPSTLAVEELPLDPSWVQLDSQRAPTVEDPQRPGFLLGRRTWTVASLESGERPLPPEVISRLYGASAEGMQTTGLGLSVRSVLAAGEDAPRPLVQFGPDFLPGAERSSGLGLGAVLALTFTALLVGALGAILVLRRKTVRSRGPTARARLEELLAVPASDVDARRQHFALSELVRGATEERLGTSRPGLTDEEWLAALRTEPRVGEDLGQTIEALLVNCQSVKYGGAEPTRFAVDETLSTARRLVTALDGIGAEVAS